jgi:hypothetical protein
MMTPKLPGNDPLAAARQHLAFEAMAKDAPSVKTILYKAQTIVPMAPVKPWERFGKAGTAMAIVLVLLFAPLIPTTSQVALVRLQFENTFTREQAQQMAYTAAANLPSQLLAAADFTVAPGQDADQTAGRLTLRMASLRLSPEDLASAALDSVDTAGARPFVTPTTAASRRTWHSIPSVLISRFSSEEREISHFAAANALANDIIANQSMLEDALAGHLAQGGYQLESMSFVENDAREPHGQDSFLLPAWPLWVNITSRDYGSLPRLQQQEVRNRAAEFIDGMLLGSDGIMLTDAPGPQLPVLLTVADRNGHADPVATRLVQAEFGGLLEAQPPLGKFETEELVDTAVATVLAGLDYEISYQQYTMFEPGGTGDTFVATSTIDGKSRQVLKEFSMPPESEQDTAEF